MLVTGLSGSPHRLNCRHRDTCWRQHIAIARGWPIEQLWPGGRRHAVIAVPSLDGSVWEWHRSRWPRGLSLSDRWPERHHQGDTPDTSRGRLRLIGCRTSWNTSSRHHTVQQLSIKEQVAVEGPGNGEANRNAYDVLSSKAVDKRFRAGSVR